MMKNKLESGLTQLSIDFDQNQIHKLLVFIELLVKWNKVYNLTAIRNPADMLNLHLFDSLSLLPYLNNVECILDVGSGAGLPGIPLAIFKPNSQFTLLDSNIKKTRFMQQAIIDLNLSNTQVVHERIEKYQPDVQFDCITTRAFATIAETLKLIDHLIIHPSRILFMKSNTVELELAELDSTISHEIIELTVPCLEATRKLVVLDR